MGTLFSSLAIARSGMTAAQVQLDTAGHNIANVNKPGFSRQRVELLSRVPITRAFGQIGRGVAIGGIERLRDTFLDDAFRRQVAGLGNAEVQAQFFARLEDIFLEPGENGLSDRLNFFFESLNEFATNVESLPIRESVLSEAEALAELLRDTDQRLFALRTDANEEIKALVPEINSLTSRIAELNQRISISEVGGLTANDLRDDRDVLVDELSKLVNVVTSERDNGQLDVIVSGEELVVGNTAREIEAVVVPGLDPDRNDLVELQIAGTGRQLVPTDGEVAALFAIRDSTLPDVAGRIDTLAATIIEQINRVHAAGNGLENLSGTITGTNAVTDPTLALNSAGLPFTVSPGTFEVHVFDNTGAPVGGTPVTINVTATTTLNQLAADLNAVPNLSATVNANNELEITAAGGFSFTFANDTSGALAAVGANVLFTGSDAGSIGVNQAILDNPALLSSAFDPDPLATGDNAAALALADVQNGLFLEGGTASINDFFESTIVRIGVDTRAVNNQLDVDRTLTESFDRRRQEVSGVSIDEEVTQLIQFQRAFEASARVVTVTDRMLDALLTMAL